MEPTQLIDALKWRYATKAFDPTKDIAPDVWDALEESLVLTPSSYGLQPWEFIVITDREYREQFVEHSWNQRQVADASHLVVMAAKKSVTEADVDAWIQATADSRGVEVSTLGTFRDMLIGGVVKGMTADEQERWAKMQTYIALGSFMTSAALLQIDVCPMEGFVATEYDRILGLAEKGLTTSVLAPAGYRADGDKYAALPKARFAREKVVTRR
ncbi:MAG: NAD(P)H-dependent oxidoreductase [Verrucomicrobiota bacterium]